MEVIFLGTGAGAPTRKRNVSSIAVRFDQSREVWLFDCGEGTQHQFQRASVSPAQVTHIFITHMHGDHLFGLPGFLSSRSLQGGSEKPLTIIGPEGIQSFVTLVLKQSQTNLSYPLYFEEITAERNVLDLPTARVEYSALLHPIKSFGYALHLPDKPGRFKVEKAVAERIPSGPLFGRLKQGEEIELSDGRRYNGMDFIESPVKGKKIVILGDTSACPSAIELSQDAHLLIHEATFAQEEAKLAMISGHSTNIDAANTAKTANVRTLVLTHFSARYDETKASAMLAEAQTIFPQTVMAFDFYQINV